MCGQEFALVIVPHTHIVYIKVCLPCLTSRGHSRPADLCLPCVYKRLVRELPSRPSLFPMPKFLSFAFFLLRDSFYKRVPELGPFQPR